MYRKRRFMFHEINRGNLLLVLFIKLFGDVYFRNQSNLPHWAKKLFRQIEIENLFRRGEWNVIAQNSHSQISKCVPIIDKSAFTVKIDNEILDLSGPALQKFALEYDAGVQLLAIAQRLATNDEAEIIAFETAVWRLCKHLGVQPPAYGDVRARPGFAGVERFWRRAVAFRRALGRTKAIYRRRKSPMLWPGERASLLWGGVVPSEIISKTTAIDPFFPVTRGFVQSDDVIFIVNGALTAEARAYIAKRGVRAIEEGAALDLLAPETRWTALIQCWRDFTRNALISSLPADFLSDVVFASVAWGRAIDRLSVTHLVVSAASGLEEQPFVTRLRAQGVKAVFWMHSCLGYHHYDILETSAFSSLLPEQSSYASDVVCAWSAYDTNILKARSIIPAADIATMKAVGPMMAGDARWLTATPEAVRASSPVVLPNTKIIVSVFELPIQIPEIWRSISSGMAHMSVENLNKFYDDILILLNKNPDISLIVKSKRDQENPSYINIPARDNFIEHVSDKSMGNRVSFLPHWVDPYFAIACSDVAISFPFSSPTSAVLSRGRDAIWYDPTSAYIHIEPSAIEPFIVRGVDALIARADRWTKGDVAPHGRPDWLKLDTLDPQQALFDAIGIADGSASTVMRAPTQDDARGRRSAPI